MRVPTSVRLLLSADPILSPFPKKCFSAIDILKPEFRVRLRGVNVNLRFSQFSFLHWYTYEPMPEDILTLTAVADEGDGVSTFLFRSEHPISYSAGQYGHLRLSGLPPEARAVREFSFASAPHEEYIRFGIDMRSGSAYQKRLAEMREGDTAILFKIKGHMTWPAPENNSVMIAGGVGITPFRSMLLARAQKKIGGRVRVIHVSSHAFIYKDELLPLADEYAAVGRAELFGALDAAIRNAPSARFYVAGSRGFVAAVSARLAESGIAADSDEFKGLTDSDFTDAAP